MTAKIMLLLHLGPTWNLPRKHIDDYYIGQTIFR